MKRLLPSSMHHHHHAKSTVMVSSGENYMCTDTWVNLIHLYMQLFFMGHQTWRRIIRGTSVTVRAWKPPGRVCGCWQPCLDRCLPHLVQHIVFFIAFYYFIKGYYTTTGLSHGLSHEGQKYDTRPCLPPVRRITHSATQCKRIGAIKPC